MFLCVGASHPSNRWYRNMENNASTLITYTTDVVAPSLALIFNRSFKEDIFPDNLKVARTCLIYKGKGSKSDPDNYLSLFCQ